MGCAGGRRGIREAARLVVTGSYTGADGRRDARGRGPGRPSLMISFRAQRNPQKRIQIRNDSFAEVSLSMLGKTMRRVPWGRLRRRIRAGRES
jgi:hypothetical protein